MFFSLPLELVCSRFSQVLSGCLKLRDSIAQPVPNPNVSPIKSDARGLPAAFEVAPETDPKTVTHPNFAEARLCGYPKVSTIESHPVGSRGKECAQVLAIARAQLGYAVVAVICHPDIHPVESYSDRIMAYAISP